MHNVYMPAVNVFYMCCYDEARLFML